MSLKARIIASCVVVFLMISLGCGLGPSRKTKVLKPVIEELHDFKKEHGVYPQSSRELPVTDKLREEYDIYFGELNDDNELVWSPRGVRGNRFTILLFEDGWTVWVPISTRRRESLSNLRVWEKTSESKRWKKVRLR